jgi:hypothetical protein
MGSLLGSRFTGKWIPYQGIFFYAYARPNKGKLSPHKHSFTRRLIHNISNIMNQEINTIVYLL